jgi:hypothetical protein
MSEKKEDRKKEKSIEERLIEYHPKFLDAIKEVYPLSLFWVHCV